MGPSLVEASGWIAAFRGQRIVVKVGGETLTKASRVNQLARQMKVLVDCGLKPVLVHGAGVQVDESCRANGIEIIKHGGRRVTSPEVLAVLIEVLTELNGNLKAAMVQAGIESVGMESGTGEILRCVRRPRGEFDWGEVGDLTGCGEIGAGLAVVPSLAMADDGPKNVNGDSAASALARGVGAIKLVFLTSTPGVMRIMNDAGPISRMSSLEARSLIESGAAQGGMKAKLEEALKALDGGVQQVHIISGQDPHGLLRELFTQEGIGTLIVP